jgi:hypothetical protein
MTNIQDNRDKYYAALPKEKVFPQIEYDVPNKDGDYLWTYQFLVIAINVLQYVAILWCVLVLYQSLSVYSTYFPPIPNNCVHSIDLGTRRWYYFFFIAMNVPDVIFSFQVNEKMWGQLTLLFNLIAVASNVLILFAVGLNYIILLPCNQVGYDLLTQICSDVRLCGLTKWLSDPSSNCQYINPTGNPFYVQLDPSTDLTWNPVFFTFFFFLCFFIFFGPIKTVLVALIPSSTFIVRSYATTAINTVQDAKALLSNNSNLVRYNGLMSGDTYSLGQQQQQQDGSTNVTATLAPEETPKYSALPFYFQWTLNQKRYYAIMMLAYFFALGCYIAWCAWFLQNVQTIYTRFKVDPKHPNYSVLERNVNTEPFLYYCLFSLQIIPLTFIPWTGTLYHNNKSFFSCLFGIFSLSVFLIWSLVYTVTCSFDGFPFNPCSDQRYKCQNPFRYAGSQCPNDYGCLPIKPYGGASNDFIVLVSFSLYLLLVEIAFALYTYFLSYDRGKYMVLSFIYDYLFCFRCYIDTEHDYQKRQ